MKNKMFKALGSVCIFCSLSFLQLPTSAFAKDELNGCSDPEGQKSALSAAHAGEMDRAISEANESLKIIEANEGVHSSKYCAGLRTLAIIQRMKGDRVGSVLNLSKAVHVPLVCSAKVAPSPWWAWSLSCTFASFPCLRKLCAVPHASPSTTS